VFKYKVDTKFKNVLLFNHVKKNKKIIWEKKRIMKIAKKKQNPAIDYIFFSLPNR
jgi:hypothetical protein